MSRRTQWRRWLILVLTLGLALILGLGLLWAMRGSELLAARWTQRWWLLLLAVVPVVLWRGTLGEDRRTPRLLVGTLKGLLTGPSGWRVHVRDVPGVLRAVALGFFITALARPINTLRAENLDESGIDLMLVLDLSGSMQAVMENVPSDLLPLMNRSMPDIPPTRLDGAKAVVRDFISRRKTDRIGVIIFGKEAFVLSPPTLDYQLLDLLVSKMELKVIDGNGTAIGDAIGAAAARLRRSTAKSKAIILLTDGDNNAGRIAPEYAADLANKVSAKIFTIQIGDGAKASVFTGFDLLRHPMFNHNLEFPVNPALLQSLAKKTGGSAYVATDVKALQASFHDVLNKLEKSRFEAAVGRYEELFPVLLLPGVLLLSIDVILRAFSLRRFP
jgi:Ca-activated chloride channel family protein